jgi:hypothetical protein
VPVDQILTRFAMLDKNILIMGDKRFTFLWAKHTIANYTTG